MTKMETEVARTRLSYLIRRVEVSDANNVCAVEKACFHDPYPRAYLNDLIRAQQDHFFVAANGEEIVGYAVGSVSGKAGHVVSVAVDPRHRRKRVGTALLSAVTAKLTAEGVKQIQLEVRKGNAGAIAFYERMGYRIISEIRHYYADAEDAWVLKRPVESSAPMDQ
jgi:ribosomal-protein-alanine N-acetyltransferase